MHKITALIFLLVTLEGCSNLKGAKLLMPEHFGFSKIAPKLYIERSASEAEKNQLIAAISRAEKQIRSAYGDVTSYPIVHACLSEHCYRAMGGMGSTAKIYGHYILLSPRGFNWHFLAHEWSHDEIRSRLKFWAWRRLPTWFDEGLAVAISEAPEHSEAHWQFLIESNVTRPTRTELMSYTSLRQWLNAVQHFGATQNRARRAKGEPEIRPLYTAAGHELRHWLDATGQPGLLRFIKRFKEGAAFSTLYPSIYTLSSQNKSL